MSKENAVTELSMDSEIHIAALLVQLERAENDSKVMLEKIYNELLALGPSAKINKAETE